MTNGVKKWVDRMWKEYKFIDKIKRDLLKPVLKEFRI